MIPEKNDVFVNVSLYPSVCLNVMLCVTSAILTTKVENSAWPIKLQ